MGAKHRAQNRSKNAAKGSMKGSPMSSKQLNQSISVPSLNPQFRGRALQNWQNFANGNDHSFTMSEEARNTERHVFGWGNTRLRDQRITFISAGTLQRDEMESPKEEDNTLETTPHAVNEVLITENTDDTNKPVSEQIRGDEERGSAEKESKTEEQNQVQKIQEQVSPQVQISIHNGQSPSEHDDDTSDSEEEIVFAGRQNSSQPSRRPTPLPDASNPPLVRPASTQINAQTILVETKPSSPSLNPLSSGPDRDSEIPQSVSPDLHDNIHLLRGYDDEEAIMQDYINNMALEDSDDPGENHKPARRNEHFRFHHGAGEEHVKVQTLSVATKKIQLSDLDQAIDWDSEDLADFDDLSTSDEEVGEVSQIVRHRVRESGPQYLVVAPGKSTGDAKWILHKKLVSESATKEIKVYEEIRNMPIDQYEDEEDDDEDSSSGEEDEEALQDLIDNIESEDDENERILRHTSRMTDEQIARALAKQEELGMDASEILLFNGDVGDIDTPDMGDALEIGGDFIPFTTRNLRRKQKKKQRDSFPSAEAFADALDQDPYGAFDIMDFDRPSLRPKRKGRKSDYPFDIEGLEDDDLREQLVNTWTKDREKKAARKREKEEERMQASLDAADGSDPTVIKFRIRQFLVQDTTTLELSPMEPGVRAAVHRLAKALKLNSRSTGKEGVGVGRYPVLTKTIRTPSYTFDNIWEVDNLLNTRKFFPKTLFKTQKLPRGSGQVKRRGGGGGVTSGATYRDGDEVAASAPEIGADNRGRAMLEKMGWTTGMAIGAVGNKGSLDPIRHIVKTTKAGLG